MIFTSSDRPVPVRAAVEALVTRDLGITSVAMIRTAKQMAAIVRASPFAGVDPKRVYVFYLADKPARQALDALGAVNPPHETFRLVGRELFVDYPHGLGTSKFANPVIERKLGIVATARNLTVTTKLAELSAAFGR